MAGSELTGIDSLEEMLLNDTQNVGSGSSEQKCDHASSKVSEQEDTTSSDSSEPLQVYAIDMDISETMGTLKSRAAEALRLDLQNYTTLILSEKELHDEETLQKQCGTSSGIVQIQFAVRRDADASAGVIDILDVLKPNEVETSPTSKPQASVSPECKTNSSESKTCKSSKTMRWIVCPAFKELQRVLKIPQDPHEWTPTHVRHWLSWSIYQFGMRGINVHSNCWNKTGEELFSLGQTEFQKLVPDDHEDIFYMHFELLRRTRVVAVLCDPNSDVPKPSPPKSSLSLAFIKSATSQVQVKNLEKLPKTVTSSGELSINNVSTGSLSPTGSGTQQIQLWQFLLELLTTPKMYPVISWYGGDGEFRLHQPEIVASLWGQRKSKPNMNYEKLSRALRYYYEGEMIAKVYGKRFVYRFVLDLKNVVGYSAEELKRQVEECHTREGFSPEFSLPLVAV